MTRPYGRRFGRRPQARPSGRSKVFDYLLTLMLFGALIGGIAYFAPAPATTDLVGKPSVVDGDTLAFSGKRVRMLGIDAPEMAQTCQTAGQSYPCGEQARTKLRELIAGRSVTCTGERFDQYGRLLVECLSGATDLNAAMVESGWAVSYGAYGTLEAKARSERSGLWAGDFDRPQNWRKAHDGQQDEVHEVDMGVKAIMRRVLKWLMTLV